MDPLCFANIISLHNPGVYSPLSLDMRVVSRDNKEEKQGDLEGPETMRDVSGAVHHIRQLASLLLKLMGDAGGFLILCL
jgi:hypothetical protein